MRRRVRQGIDALAYALVLTSVVFVLASAVSYPLGLGLLGTKWIMFFVGFALFGYATFQLRPTPPWKREESMEAEDDDRVRGIQKWVGEALPESVRLPPDERLPVDAKLFLSSLLVLLTSFLLEAILRIGY